VEDQSSDSENQETKTVPHAPLSHPFTERCAGPAKLVYGEFLKMQKFNVLLEICHAQGITGNWLYFNLRNTGLYIRSIYWTGQDVLLRGDAKPGHPVATQDSALECRKAPLARGGRGFL
jgi:hypothetical protein